MNKKIITLLIVLFISVSMVWAENDTSDELEADDNANYIMPVSIGENGIKFSDGFIGFSLDDSDLTKSDGFTQEPTGNDNLQNYIKLAIIECYKQSREEIGEIVGSFCDGSYKNSDDELITAVLDSGEKIGDHVVVELDDGSKATFDFELLKSSEDKSDCLAYKVSIDESTQDTKLGASDSTTKDTSKSDDTPEVSDDNDTSKESEPAVSAKNKDNAQKTTDEDNNTQVNETNKTIVNKTNTVIVHEKNTTIITKENVKNDTPQDTLLKTAGNPLFILAVVAVVIIAAVVYKSRKD